MLNELLDKLCDELDVPGTVPLKGKDSFLFAISNDVRVAVKDLGPGVSMSAEIVPCPERRREDLFIFLMRANLLGQGTGNTRIGLDETEKTLTLSLGVPYELNYESLKDTMENFVNYLIYWREEITKFDNE